MSTRPPEILVVDDEAAIRRSVCEVLRDEGYSVADAADGAAALAYLRSGARPGLILLDLNMPVLDGWGFIEVWRSDPAFAAIPIVVTSAFASASRDQLWCDVACVLEKPFTLAALCATVERYAVTDESHRRGIA